MDIGLHQHTVNVGPRRERGEVGERLRHIVVCPIDVLVFLAGGMGQRTQSELGTCPYQSCRRRDGLTLVRTLYSQFSTCCWTAMAGGGRRCVDE